MVTVYYTKEFVSGPLKNVRVETTISYPTAEQCARFVQKGRTQLQRSPFGFRAQWRIVDASFQRYTR